MDIKIKRRLDYVDNTVIRHIEIYYAGADNFSNTPNNYGSWSSYKDCVVQSVLTTLQLRFTFLDLIDCWNYEIEYELKDYILSRHNDRLYNEYKKTTGYIQNELHST